MSQLRELKCPNCGASVPSAPAATRARCASCGTEFAVDIDREEARIYVTDRQVTEQERDRFSGEHDHLYSRYIELRDRVQQIDRTLTTPQPRQRTPEAQNEIQMLWVERDDKAKEMEALRSRLLAIEAQTSPGMPTAIPEVPARPIPNKASPLGRIAVGVLALLVIGGTLFSLLANNGKKGSQVTQSAEPGKSTATSVIQPIQTEQSTPAGTSSVIPTPPETGYEYARETRHSITYFAAPFKELGGVAVLGYPLTEAFVEKRDPGLLWVQYFEKAVLEYHPEMSDSNKYQLARLGAERLSRKYGSKIPDAKPLPSTNSQTFPETGYSVSDPFLAYWHTNGGLRRFGYPITASFEEQSDADGKLYIVQYFERAVMEYHPEASAPYDVQLTALGSLRLQALYPDGAPSHADRPVEERVP